MKSFTVSKADNGIRLNRYLERCVPSLTAGLMYKYLRLKRIKLNGKRCEASTRLNEGDTLELYISDELLAEEKKAPDFMRASKNIEIINFPTKDHWKNPSEYEYIEKGLIWLSNYLKEKDTLTLTLPALGCGHGGLDWIIVKKLIQKY